MCQSEYIEGVQQTAGIKYHDSGRIESNRVEVLTNDEGEGSDIRSPCTGCVYEHLSCLNALRTKLCCDQPLRLTHQGRLGPASAPGSKRKVAQITARNPQNEQFQLTKVATQWSVSLASEALFNERIASWWNQNGDTSQFVFRVTNSRSTPWPELPPIGVTTIWGAAFLNSDRP